MRCKARGILTAIDPNVRPVLIPNRDSYLDRLRRMMKKVDIFKLSDEDLLWLYPDHALDAALEMCRAECDAALFVLTMGPDGARGFAGGADLTVPATPVPQMVDTVGAGDTFMASILAWALETGRTDRAALNAIDLDGLTELACVYVLDEVELEGLGLLLVEYFLHALIASVGIDLSLGDWE